MPSKNMLPKGKRRQSVKQEYRAARTQANELAEAKRARVEAFEEEPSSAPVLINTADMMEHEPTMEERVLRNDWITTRGASGSKVAEETHEAPRYANPYKDLNKVVPETAAAPAPEIQVLEDLEPEDGVRTLTVEPAGDGMRVDAFLAKALPDISRARVQVLIKAGQVTVNGQVAMSKLKLEGGEVIEIEGEPKLEPLHATAEDIPLSMVYEDDDLAVIDKAAGMMVHAGSGEEGSRGTLVNALLHHMGAGLSQVGGELRPGIVHRLDKQTSGLIVVAKNDSAHRKLSELFADRKLRKIYIALVQGEMDGEEGTVRLAIARDLVRRVRMTTKRPGGRNAVTHWKVLERIVGPYGKFTLLEVRIETGRTHQIRVHMQALGHPVVGDFLYGAPHFVKPVGKGSTLEPIELQRNFLHAAELEFQHPKTKKMLELKAPLPELLEQTLEKLRRA